MHIALNYTNLGRARVAILCPAGALDWSNCDELIERAMAARAAGARWLIVDLSDVARVGTAGLVCLYVVGQLGRGMEPPDPQSGWAAIRALAEDRQSTPPLALVAARQPIRQILAKTPFSEHFAVYATLDAALAALLLAERDPKPGAGSLLEQALDRPVQRAGWQAPQC